MSKPTGSMRVSAHTLIRADIRNCNRLDVYGTVEGDVFAEEIVVHDGGRVVGRIRASSMEVFGKLEGDVVVRNLIAVRATGTVHGDVQYGRMALDPGGELAAKVRNVPPHLVGDFQISVPRTAHVVVTPQDINAVDPDSVPAELQYVISNTRGGHIANAASPEQALCNFTQAELNQGTVIFVHHGSAEKTARFDVVVHDQAGASSGRPRTVDVLVVDRG